MSVAIKSRSNNRASNYPDGVCLHSGKKQRQLIFNSPLGSGVSVGEAVNLQLDAV